MLAAMAERVAAIREIDVQNDTALGILKAIIAVVGELSKSPG
jgi:hypothetical protein